YFIVCLYQCILTKNIFEPFHFFIAHLTCHEYFHIGQVVTSFVERQYIFPGQSFYFFFFRKPAVGMKLTKYKRVYTLIGYKFALPEVDQQALNSILFMYA